MQNETKYKTIFEALKEEILGGKYSATRKLPMDRSSRQMRGTTGVPSDLSSPFRAARSSRPSAGK